MSLPNLPDWVAPTHPNHDRLLGSNPTTIAECCNRRTSADMILDLRGMSPGIRSQIGFANKDFICDACRESLFRNSRISRCDFLTALGAPKSVTDRIRRKEVPGGGQAE